MNTPLIHRRMTLPAAEIGTRANYVLTVAADTIVAQALQWFLRRPDFDLARCLSIVRNPSLIHRAWIVLAMQHAPIHLRQSMRERRAHNLVPSLLRNSLATLTSGTDVAPTFKANYLALGDSNVAPAAGNTTLGNELVRALFNDRSAEEHIAYLNVFFPANEVGGLGIEEAGIFVDGTGSADSGYLLSRVLLEATLAANETLTINASISYVAV